jgi:hypothetical protein
MRIKEKVTSGESMRKHIFGRAFPWAKCWPTDGSRSSYERSWWKRKKKSTNENGPMCYVTRGKSLEMPSGAVSRLIYIFQKNLENICCVKWAFQFFVGVVYVFFMMGNGMQLFFKFKYYLRQVHCNNISNDFLN